MPKFVEEEKKKKPRLVKIIGLKVKEGEKQLLKAGEAYNVNPDLADSLVKLKRAKLG